MTVLRRFGPSCVGVDLSNFILRQEFVYVSAFTGNILTVTTLSLETYTLFNLKLI